MIIAPLISFKGALLLDSLYHIHRLFIEKLRILIYNIPIKDRKEVDIMKKVLSILIIATMLFTCSILQAGAVSDAAENVVDVKKGDEVVYTLYLSDVPEKVVGCDLSVYYDSSIFEVKSVSDFTGNTDPDEYNSVLNPDIKGVIYNNWSILSGVKFQSKRQLISVTLTAIGEGSTHLSYYVRYLYPDSMEQFTDYKFTCDLLLNKAPVYEDAEPELNVVEPQDNGEFTNSVTGLSKDANVNTYKNPIKKGDAANENGGDANENNVVSKGDSSSKVESANNNSSSSAVTAETVKDENGEIVYLVDGATSDTASPSQTNGGNFPWAIVIICVAVVAAGAGVAVYLIKQKKKKSV